MTELKRVRTAVVGCGYWGKHLVRNFAAQSDLRLCCDVSDPVRARLAREHPGVAVTDSFARVLDDSGIDAVIIATPAAAHAEMAIAALSAGKHVFVEKPLALHLAGAECAASAADSAGLVLMVGHLLEYHPAVEYLKGLVDRGELGDVYYCYSHRVNLGKLRSDENALWSLAPHDVAVMLYLMGEEPEEIEATGQAFLQPEIEDVVFLTLRFRSGRMGHIQVSWLDPHKTRRLTVVGSGKMAVFDDMQPQEKVRVYDKGVDRRPGEAAPYASYGELLSLREGDVVIPRIAGREPLAIECEEFLRSVVTGIPPRSDAQDGVRVVRVLTRAQDRLRSRRVSFHGVARWAS